MIKSDRKIILVNIRKLLSSMFGGMKSRELDINYNEMNVIPAKEGFCEELELLEKECENALIKLFNLTDADGFDWIIDLPDSTKKITVSASIKT